MNIVYCGYVREERFVDGIQINMPEEFRTPLTQRFSLDPQVLDYTDAAVFVGTQTNIFQPFPRTYFEALRELRRRQISVAVIPRGSDRQLPADLIAAVSVIERNEKSLKQIADELSCFLGVNS